MARITQYQPLAQVGPKSASFKERTTPDKYIPNEPKTFVRPAIAAAALLASVTALAFVPPVNAQKTWVERVTADKVYVEIQRPVKRFDLTRAQYSYYETRGGLFFVPFGDGVKKNWQEKPQPDKWWQQPSEPLRDVRRAQYAPQAYAAPDRQQVPDLDSWVPATNLRLFDQKRTQYSYPYYGAADRQQVPDLDSWWQQASEYLPQPDRRVLRNGDSQLTLTDGQTDELVSVDRYWQQASEAIRDVRCSQNLYPSYCAPDQQQVPDLDSWVPLANQPQFDQKRVQFDYEYWFAPDRQQVTELDSWWQQPSEFLRQRRAATLPDAPGLAIVPSEQIFAEKWHPELQRPVYDVARRQFGFPSLAVPERQPVPLALAHIQSADPRFDLKRAQYTNPWFSTADRQQLPDLDSWVPAANQPQFDLKRSQFLAARSEWTSTFTANRVFPDSWHPEVKPPQFDLRRTQYLDPSHFGADRQSEPRLDSWWQQLSEAVRLPDRRVQGQGFTILGVPPTEDIEEVSPDRWQPLTNQPLFDKQRTQYLLARTEWTSTFTANRVFLDSWYVNVEQPRFDSKRTQFLAARTEWVSTFVANRAFPDSWHPESNKPQFDAKRIQALYPAFFGSDRQPEPRFDSWWQLPGQPQFDLRRSQFLPPSSVEPDRQSQPRVDSWWQQAQEFLRQPDRRVLRLGASELDLTPAQDVERTSVDKYYPSIQQPQFDKRRSQYGFTFTFFYPQPYASPIFADSWHPLTGQPLFDRDRRVQRLGDSELTLAANQEPERTTPDKWHPAIEEPQFDKRRQQGGYPAYFAPERQADVRFDSWWQRTSELIPSREFRIQAFENGGLPFTPRAIFVDSWWQQTNERLLRVPSRLYLADFFTSGTTPAERTSIDKYDPGTERPQFDLARKQYLAQTFAFSERQTEPRFDSWYQPLSEAVRRNDWRQYDAPSLGEPEREPEITDWLLQASEPLRKQRGSVEGVQGIPFTPERISIDKWYATVLDPSGRQARFFLYPSYFSPERQSTPRTESWYIAVGEPQRILARRLSENAALPVTTVSETSVDEWHPAANQPLFSVSRTQHGYLVTSLPTAPPVPSRPGIVLISSSTARVLAGSELIDTLTSGSTGPGIAISSKVKGTVEASSEVAEIRIKSEPQH